MSYNVVLRENGQAVRVKMHVEGGTYAIGGSDIALLNVTYNYGARYAEVEVAGGDAVPFSLRLLQDCRAADTIDWLEAVVEQLGTEQADDYWEPTPGNAGYAASVLLCWARQYPDAIWEVH